jgi:hypothetical protein
MSQKLGFWAFVLKKIYCTLISNHPISPPIHPRFAPKNWFNPSPFPSESEENAVPDRLAGNTPPSPRPATPVENQLRSWRGTAFRGHRAQSQSRIS